MYVVFWVRYVYMWLCLPYFITIEFEFPAEFGKIYKILKWQQQQQQSQSKPGNVIYFIVAKISIPAQMRGVRLLKRYYREFANNMRNRHEYIQHTANV